MKLAALRPKRKARIEMIPLIDIVFLLLVFFIYAMISMTVHRGIKVTLPKAETGAVDARAPILVTLRAAGAIEIEGKPVSVEGVAAAVGQIRQLRPNSPVLISGDEAASLGIAIDILDRLGKAGIRRVTFLTTPRTLE